MSCYIYELWTYFIDFPDSFKVHCGQWVAYLRLTFRNLFLGLDFGLGLSISHFIRFSRRSNFSDLNSLHRDPSGVDNLKRIRTGSCKLLAQYLTLKIPGPHFPSNYRVNANWHEGFNGIFCSLFALSESSCWCLWVVQVWPEPYMSSEWLNPPSWALECWWEVWG